MRTLIATVRNLPGVDPAIAVTVVAPMRAVLHQVADEETVLLPLAECLQANRLAEPGSTRRGRDATALNA